MGFLHMSHIILQLLHIGNCSSQTLCAVCHLVQIQSGNLHTAADTNRILILIAVSRILNIECAA